MFEKDLISLKEKGEAPQFLTLEGYQTLINGYLLPEETPKGMWKRISKYASQILNKPELEEKFFNLFWKGWLCGATPILSNFGSSRGLPISCNSLHLNDSINSIFKKNHELAMLSKHGAGVGIYAGDIRGRGANISGNGKSEGIVPWLKCLDTTTVAVSQGCYDEQTELLTEKGWVFFKDLPNYTNLKVAQVTQDKNIEFVNYYDYIKYQVNEELYYFNNKTSSINLLVTGNHNMVIEKEKKISHKRDKNGKYLNHKKAFTNKLEFVLAEKLKCHRDNRMWSACPIKNNNDKKSLTNLEKLAIAYQADGASNPSGNSNGDKSGTIIYNFHFSKQRKIDRLISILDEVGYYYTYICNNPDTTTISVRFPLNNLPSKKLSDSFELNKFTEESAKDFINEVSLWDGSNYQTSKTYCSTLEENVDFVQCVAVLAGYFTNKQISSNRDGNRQDLYSIYITTTRCTVGGEDINIIKQLYNDNVYCVSVPSKMILVRRNGRTLVCGNSTRRGASAVYLPIDHLDIDEFLNIRKPIGDMNRRCLNLHHAVCITDDFMNKVQNGDERSRHLWKEVLKTRFETGEPYLFFTENVNNQAPECYKKNNLKIKTSNICNEIFLFTDPDHTFVCCISSMNLFKYDEWKDTDAVQLAIWFLDAVMQDYIDKAKDKPGFEAAIRFAEKSRALGLGVLGWHSLLQKNKIPFDSFDAMALNAEIFKHIRSEADIATRNLAKEYGEPKWCKGFGIRNSHVLAVAPTVSNSIISGSVSAGIEPIAANVFSLKTAKGTFMRYNPILKQLLEDKGKDNIDTWKEINQNDGGVQSLSFLNENEKEVFLTAREINQFAIIKQAAQRQKWIDQGQSVNLFFGKNSDPKYIHEVHLEAWKLGLKGLYYCRAESVLKGDSISRQKDECKACEG